MGEWEIVLALAAGLGAYLLGRWDGIRTFEKHTFPAMERLMILVKQGEEVVEDFLPNVGQCVLQDYGRMNEFLIEAAKIKDPRDE